MSHQYSITLPSFVIHDLDILIKQHNLHSHGRDNCCIVSRGLHDSVYHGFFVYDVDWREWELFSYETFCYLVDSKNKAVYMQALVYILNNIK